MSSRAGSVVSTRGHWAVASMLLVASLLLPMGTASAQFGIFPPVQTMLFNDVAVETIVTDVLDVTAIDAAPDGRLFIMERTGRLKIWHPLDGSLTTAGRIEVDSWYAVQCDDCGEAGLLDEGGAHGLLLANDFADTGHLFIYYSVYDSLGVAPEPPSLSDCCGDEEGKFRLSRFTLLPDETLDLASEVTIMENPAEWAHCCHYAGDIEYMADGTLLLSTGDDTISSLSGGMGPRDKRPGMEYNDADRTAQNPLDRRGKLLRLNVDGSVPDDNPFVGNPDYDPYVYAMGLRNPYKFVVDEESQNVLVGVVGPDASNPDPQRGPAAMDEIELIPFGGGTNHGWPRCIGPNTPYNDYDWETSTAGDPLSCDGMTPALIWYARSTLSGSDMTSHPTWVLLGGGGNTAISGVIYEQNGGSLQLPDRFQDNYVWSEFSRAGLIKHPMTAERSIDVDALEVFAWNTGKIIDLDQGVDGAIYLSSYGTVNYKNTDTDIKRVVCTGCVANEDDYTYDDAPTAVSDDTQSSPGAPTPPSASPDPLPATGGGPNPLLLAGAMATMLIGSVRRRRVV